MAQQLINIGSAPNDGTGDLLRNAFDKTNDNFTELYNNKDKYAPQAQGVEMNFQAEVLDDGGEYHPNTGSGVVAGLMADGLYKKANLIVTPAGTKAGTGVGDGTLYSIKGSDFTVDRSGKKSYTDIDGYKRFVAIDEATIDYGNNVAVINNAVASSNQILYPFSYDNSYWSKTGVTVDDNGGSKYASPFKDNSGNIYNIAEKIVEDTSTGLHYIQKQAIAVTSGVVTEMFIIKQYGTRNAKLRFYFDGANIGYNADFDFANEQLININTNIINYSVIKLADNWYSVSISANVPTGTTASRSIIYITDETFDYNYTGDGTSGIYLAGTQFEKQSSSTPFINDPADAEGFVVSRSADNNYVTVPTGTVKIIETFSDDTTNEITTIPTTYTMTNGKDYKSVVFYTSI